MKTTETERRADARYAESVIKEIFKGLPTLALRSYLEFLNASIEFLSSTYSDRWGITLFEDKIRLNVGWVEVLILRRDGLRVLVEKESAPPGTKFVRVKYETAPGCDMTAVPLSSLRTRLKPLSEAHLSAVSIAAKRKSPKSIREAHSRGVIEYLSKFLKKPASSPSYQLEGTLGQDYLVLWKYPEALVVEGSVITSAFGKHAGSLKKGDRMFVVATNKDELYLLGAIQVQRASGKRADGENLSGAFRRIPLKGSKWRLRFEGTTSTKLTKTTRLAMQVRARRRLSPSSADLLLGILATELRKTEDNFRVSEGRLKQMTLSTRERSRTVRIQALALKGTTCEICDFDFAETYGGFARNCVEVHHIKGLSNAGHRGVKTSLDDVLVLCPNCHRALHQFGAPNDWKAFRRVCRLG